MLYLYQIVRGLSLETVKQCSSNETIEVDWENWDAALLIPYRPRRPVMCWSLMYETIWILYRYQLWYRVYICKREIFEVVVIMKTNNFEDSFWNRNPPTRKFMIYRNRLYPIRSFYRRSIKNNQTNWYQYCSRSLVGCLVASHDCSCVYSSIISR